jgi:hypothetical protein
MRIPGFLHLRTVQVALAIVAVLIAVRAVLPIAIERFANKTLDSLEGYSGHIEDVDLALIRGAYVIEGVRIVKTGGKVPVPFFSASEIDLSVQWGALLDGVIVSEIDVRSPKINFVTEPSGEEAKTSEQKKAKARQSQTEPASNWTDVVKELTPFKINRFSISDGRVHYRDFGSKPKVDVYVQNIDAEARNLTNSEERPGSLVSTFEARALAMKSGRIRMDGKVNPYAKAPTFDVALRLNDLDLRQLNPYLRAYAKIDVERGSFSLDSELAAKEGRFNGYVKPFIEKLDVVRWGQEEESLPNKAWQAAVEAAGELFQDQSRDRTATRIPIEGRFDQPDIDVWSAVGNLLRNAFIEALQRGLEGSIDVEKVAGKDSDAPQRSDTKDGEKSERRGDDAREDDGRKGDGPGKPRQ